MSEKEEFIGQAMEAINAGDFARALAIIDLLTAEHGGTLAAYYLRGEAYHRMGNLPQADEVLTIAAQNAPTNAEISFKLGVVRFERDDFAGAAAVLSVAAEANPDKADIWFYLGRTYFQSERMEEAEQAFRRAIAVDEGAYQAKINLLVTLGVQEKTDAALELLDALYETAPMQEEAPNALMQTYIGRGLYEPALELAERLVARFPDRAYWRGTMGALLLSTGRAEDAANTCRQAVVMEPGSVLAVTHLGLALRALGRTQEAAQILTWAVSLDPDAMTSQMGLAGIFLDEARYTEALRVVDDYDVRNGRAPAPRRSVVIAVLDYSPGSPYNINTLLENLQEFDGEVICVFNGDEVFNDLRNHPRIDKFSYNKHNVGVSRGWNIGLNQAEGDTIHILNADLRISVEMLYRMENWVQTLPDALCVGTTAHWLDFTTKKEIRRLTVGAVPGPIETDMVSGQLFTFHAGRLHDAGISFDPRLAPYFGEEEDLALKAKQNGLKIYAVPETDFEHPWGISRRDRPIYCFGQLVNRTRCMVKNNALLKRKFDQYLGSLREDER